MKFFSGFSLKNEEELFEFWLKDSSKYTVAGFSYGAIKALEYALNSKDRVDKLILLSPAFFNDKDEKYKRLQLIYFKKNPKLYIDNFINNISINSSINITNYLTTGTFKELEELLYYKWDSSKIEMLKNRGVTIEVVLGANDKIIDSNIALEFFKEQAVTYYIKDANHILRSK